MILPSCAIWTIHIASPITQEAKLSWILIANLYATLNHQSLPNWAFVITWYKVMPHGWNEMDITNTFQLVIVVDEAYSFFIFNYDSLKWPNKMIDRPVQVGYNLNGNGINSFFTMRESMSSKVAELSQKSNVNITGKFIFRIENQSN